MRQNHLQGYGRVVARPFGSSILCELLGRDDTAIAIHFRIRGLAKQRDDFRDVVHRLPLYSASRGPFRWYSFFSSDSSVGGLWLLFLLGYNLSIASAFLARAQPDLPATEVFSAVEIQVLHLRVTKALPPVAQALNLREVVRMLGKLGGHLGRKGDGEPGVLILWRGWMRLYESVEMLRSLQSAGLVEAH
jgi:hypothetical protein